MRSLALVLAGSALLVTASFTEAHAAAEPGSGLGSFNLAASAPGVQLREDDPSTCFKMAAAANGCEGVVPEAVSTLQNGPIGHGLATVAWPGVIGSGAGSLIITVGGASVPPGVAALNDPVRADAYTSVGPPTASYDVPGTTMTATALPTKVTAEAAVGSSQSAPVGTFGSTRSTSSASLDGPSLGVAVAHSEAKDVMVAGVIHIGSVVSDARATTDGLTATASGRTLASGITVAGMPVTVDDRGVTFSGSSTSLGAGQDAVNTALKSAGVTMALGAPTGKPDGPSAAYNAQSLVIVFTNPTGFTSTVVLGGANVSVVSTPALRFFTPLPPGTPTVAPPLFPQAPGVSAPDVPVETGPELPSYVSPITAPPGSVVVPTSLAAVIPHPPDGLSTRLVLLTLGGAGLVLAGLRRLPDKVLLDHPRECLLEESP